jgi:hypothetical protein
MGFSRTETTFGSLFVFEIRFRGAGFSMSDGADNAKLNEMHAKDTVVNALCNVLIMAIPSAAKKENKTGYKNRDEIKEKLKSAGIMYSTHNSKELEEAGFYK